MTECHCHVRKTNRERYEALVAAYNSLWGGMDQPVSFATFVAAVDEYERHMGRTHGQDQR